MATQNSWEDLRRCQAEIEKEKDRLKAQECAKMYAELMKPNPNTPTFKEIKKALNIAPQHQQLLLLEDEMNGY